MLVCLALESDSEVVTLTSDKDHGVTAHFGGQHSLSHLDREEGTSKHKLCLVAPDSLRPLGLEVHPVIG